ncbi:MAG: nuclear transport factor 2 family protein [Acidimicrobiia bacterium]|nr:nuclear transport factor 2 family protein [Acidimicrobiia bacterium]
MPDQDLMARLERMADENDIRHVYYRYCRGLDRWQWDVVRDCYHPDATDDHGDFRGNVDDFIAMISEAMPRLESSTHFIGNLLIEVDGLKARGEAYAIAFSRLPAKGERPARDQWTGFRYVDDFEKRSGEWRIAKRVCVFEWTRTDPVGPGWEFSEVFRRGLHTTEDPVFLPSLTELR